MSKINSVDKKPIDTYIDWLRLNYNLPIWQEQLVRKFISNPGIKSKINIIIPKDLGRREVESCLKQFINQD